MRFKQLWSLLALVVLILVLMRLGIWQLERAKIKQAILQAFDRAKLQPIRDCRTKPSPRDWEQCRYQGRVGRELLYLDNQFMGHALGYEVFTVLTLASGEHLLVDLGWVERGADRHQLPIVTQPQILSFTGQVYYPKLAKLKLGELLEAQQGSRYVIEYLDVAALQTLLKRPLLPWVLRMSLQQTTGLKRAWKLVAVAPARHYAYAAQWFGMAAVVFLILIWRIFKRCNNEES